MSPTIWPSEFLVGGMNDPSVYMHCEVGIGVVGGGGIYLGGCLGDSYWWEGVVSGGIFPCVREFDMVVR